MMLALRYAMRDLKGALSSLKIAFMCLFLGVGVIAALQFTSQTVLDGIEKNGRTILGGDMVIRSIYEPTPEALKEWFVRRKAQTIETVEARVMLANAQSDDNTLVELKAVPRQYPLYGIFQSGSDAPLSRSLEGRGILLDPALRDRLNLQVGSEVRLGVAVFKVRGFIVNEPDRAGGSRFGLAPRAMISTDDMESTGLFQAGSMIYHDLRVKLEPGSDLKETKESLEASFPGAGWKIADADNASPQIKRFVDRLVMFLTLVGLSALLIGGIGIGNGIRAHFEERLKTIAVLKCLGAPVRFIVQIYALQIALIGISGTVAGSLAGALVPYFVAPMLTEILPFTVEPVLTWQGVLIPTVYGLLTVAVFAAWPLGKAVKTMPLELFHSARTPLSAKPSRKFQLVTALLVLTLIATAISTAQNTLFAIWFVIGGAASLMFFYGLGVLIAAIAGNIPIPRYPAVRLALRNLHRPGNATANILISLGLGLTVMVSVSLIELNLRYGIVQNLPKDAPAFFFMDIQGNQKDDFIKLLDEQESTSTTVLSPNLRGRIVSINGVPAADALKDQSERWLLQNDRGFTYISDLPAHSEVIDGEWWPSNYTGPPLISVVDDVVKAFDVKPGDKMVVNILGRDIEATIANTRTVNWMNFTVNFAISFAPGTLEAAPHSWLATVVADPAQETAIQRNIGRAFPNISMIRLSDAVNTAGALLGNMANAVRGTALVAIIAGILVLAGSLAATRTARVYDTVILKVLGTRRSTIISGFLFEFGFLGFIAAVVSLALGSLVSWAVMVLLMDLSWAFYPVPAILTLLAGIFLTLAISWAVMGNVLRSSPAIYLRNE